MQQHGQEYTRPRDYHLQGTIRKTHRIEDATIGIQETLSGAVDLRGYGLIGLALPDLDNCSLGFQVSDIEAGTYVPLCNAGGVPVAVIVGTGDRVIATEDLGMLAAYRWVKVEASKAQNAIRTLHFIVKG